MRAAEEMHKHEGLELARERLRGAQRALTRRGNCSAVALNGRVSSVCLPWRESAAPDYAELIGARSCFLQDRDGSGKKHP